MVQVYRALPSAAILYSRGRVYPLAFFQLEIHGGIFQSFMSLAVSFLGGLCKMVEGGEGGPCGIFLCLWPVGIIGSAWIFYIFINRQLAPELEAPWLLGVYLITDELACFMDWAVPCIVEAFSHRIVDSLSFVC